MTVHVLIMRKRLSFQISDRRRGQWRLLHENLPYGASSHDVPNVRQFRRPQIFVMIEKAALSIEWTSSW